MVSEDGESRSITQIKILRQTILLRNPIFIGLLSKWNGFKELTFDPEIQSVAIGLAFVVDRHARVPSRALSGDLLQHQALIDQNQPCWYVVTQHHALKTDQH